MLIDDVVSIIIIKCTNWLIAAISIMQVNIGQITKVNIIWISIDAGSEYRKLSIILMTMSLINEQIQLACCSLQIIFE